MFNSWESAYKIDSYEHDIIYTLHYVLYAYAGREIERRDG